MTKAVHPHPRAACATEHLDPQELERIRAIAFPRDDDAGVPDDMATTAIEPLSHRRPAVLLDPKSLAWSPALTPQGCVPLKPEAFARGTNVEWVQHLEDLDRPRELTAVVRLQTRDLRGFAVGLAVGLAGVVAVLVAGIAH